jgi:hypothetical protein
MASVVVSLAYVTQAIHGPTSLLSSCTTVIQQLNEQVSKKLVGVKKMEPSGVEPETSTMLGFKANAKIARYQLRHSPIDDG